MNLQQKHLDIFAIQEAHCPDNLIESWTQFFYPKVSFWTHYCAFILSPSINYSNFKKYFCDTEFKNRMISIDIIFDNIPITILIFMHLTIT